MPSQWKQQEFQRIQVELDVYECLRHSAVRNSVPSDSEQQKIPSNAGFWDVFFVNKADRSHPSHANLKKYDRNVESLAVHQMMQTNLSKQH